MSTAAESIPRYRIIPAWQKFYPRFFVFVFFCMSHARKQSHLMLSWRLFFTCIHHGEHHFKISCAIPARLQNDSPTCLIQWVKVIHHCDWEDNKPVLPSCTRTPRCIVVHWCPACGYHNQACNCVIAAQLQWHSLIFFFHIFFSVHRYAPLLLSHTLNQSGMLAAFIEANTAWFSKLKLMWTSARIYQDNTRNQTALKGWLLLLTLWCYIQHVIIDVPCLKLYQMPMVSVSSACSSAFSAQSICFFLSSWTSW